MPPTQALLAFAAFPLVAVVLFLLMPLRRAILAAFLAGWMFLPQAQIEIPGVFPDLGRGAILGAAVLAVLVVLDPRRAASFRPGWVDAPMIAFLCVPLLTSISNGLGVYDGLSAIVNRALVWAPAYLLGRVYFSDREGLRQLALAVFVGGLVYAPLCLLEARMSPQLHNWVYGYHQHSFLQTIRLGGFRPQAFMQHGLATAMWMATATLAGAWLYVTGTLRRPLWGLLLVGLALTTVLCRSLGALGLLGLGALVLVNARATRRATVLAAILVVAPVYVTLRATGAWSGESLTSAMKTVLPVDRVQSVEYRLHNETMLADKAKERVLLGWGGWSRALVKTKRGDDASVTDGWWILVFGQNGVVGLVAFLVATALPTVLFLVRVPARLWRRPEVAPAAVLATICALYTLDNLLNAMFNPLATFALGALGGALRGRGALRRLLGLDAAARSAFLAPGGEQSAVATAPWTPSPLSSQRFTCPPATGPQVAPAPRAPGAGADEGTTQ